MTEPLHSVVIPVLNGERHIHDTLRSVLAQLGPQDEVLVIDNGSTDGTRAVVQGIGDARIRLSTEERRGPSPARNAGLRIARGRYLSFLDHDDLWPEGRLAGLQRALDGTPGADAAHGRLRVRFDVPDLPRYAALDGQHAPWVTLMSYLFDRALITRVGFFDESFDTGEDTDYLVRLRHAGMRAVEYDGDAVIYRRHGGNLTARQGSVARGILHVLARNVARRRASAES